MSAFTVSEYATTQYGWTTVTVTLFVKMGRGIQSRLEQAIAYGCGYSDHDDVELEGDGPGTYRALLRTLRKIEFGESDDIQISREYSVVQRRFIYRAEYKTHRHTLGHANGSVERALRRKPSDRERVEVKVVICD